MKLGFPEVENLLSLVPPSQWFHTVQLPFSPDSSFTCTTLLQTSHQLLDDLHRLNFFKATWNFLKICSEIHSSYFTLLCSISKGRFVFLFVALFSWLPPTCVEALRTNLSELSMLFLYLSINIPPAGCKEESFSGFSEIIQLCCWYIAWDCFLSDCIQCG